MVSWFGVAAAGCVGLPQPPPPENYVAAGLTLPPSPPHAVGPMTPLQHIGVEAAASGSVVRHAARTMAQGAPGNLIPAFTARGRLTYGATSRVELGADFTYGDTSTVRRVATDATTSGLDATRVWELDGTLRVAVLRRERWSLLIGGELGDSPLPYTIRSADSPGVVIEADHKAWFQLRAAIEGLYRVTPRIVASAGASVQRFPLFYRSTVDSVCDLATSSCSPDSRPGTTLDATYATPYASLAYRIAELELRLAAFYTLTASSDLRSAAPGGATLSIGYRFDLSGFRGFDIGTPPPL